MTDPTSTAPVPPPGALHITTRFWWMSFMLAFVRPRLQLDGVGEDQRPWGLTSWWVTPGPHTVRCWFRWMLFDRAGDSTASVVVPPGHAVSLTWEAPRWFVFSPGRWTLGPPVPIDPGAPSAVASAGVPPAAAAGPPAGWHPDPAARHELRYWDGAAWTPYVSDVGVTGTDPI